MKTIKVSLWMTILLMLSGCVATNNAAIGEAGTGAKPQNRAQLNSNFYQHWVNAYEEQGGNTRLNIFRPAGSQDFSQGGFRMELDFKPDGTCRYKDVNSGNMWRCVYTKIGKKVYMYNHQGGLLGDLIFTLVEEPRQDMMRLTYGILSAIKKEKPAAKAK